jgi:hypothetical protein
VPGRAQGGGGRTRLVVRMRSVPRYQWTRAVFASTALSSNARLVACALAEYAGAAWAPVWPSQMRIQKMTGLSESAVKRAMRELRAGWITALTDEALRHSDAPTAVGAALERMSGKDPRQRVYVLTQDVGI